MSNPIDDRINYEGRAAYDALCHARDYARLESLRTGSDFWFVLANDTARLADRIEREYPPREVTS